MSHYINVFKPYVKLYAVYMSVLDMIKNFVGGVCLSHCRAEKPFDFCVCSVTYNKLKCQIDKLFDFLHSHSKGMLSGAKADIVSNSVAQISRSQHVVDEICWDRTCLILNYMTPGILHGEIDKHTK